MLATKQALLLDMNSTFMFGEDRFGDTVDYSVYFHELGGKLPKDTVNGVIRDACAYLDIRYPDEEYRHSFPSVEEAVTRVTDGKLLNREKSLILETFSFHEHGHIPDEYIKALHELNSRFTLSLVIDIWSSKERWLNTFEQKRINTLFTAMSFSSDHGMVKPSPKPFELVFEKLGLSKEACVVIGDSIRRDLGGALAAGIDCILVGESRNEQAIAHYSNLLEFTAQIARK